MPDTQEITSKTPLEIMRKILHFYPLPSLTLLTFSSLKKGSPDEQTACIKHFLQGQLTCDLAEVSEVQSRWFAHCNLKGRMVSLGRLVQIKEVYFLVLPKNIAQTAQQHLEKYAAFSRISIDEKANFQCFGLSSETPIENYPPTQNEVLTQGSLSLISLGDQRWLGLSPETPNFSDEFALIPHAETEWLIQEIQHLSPFLTPETVGKFLPHDIELPQKLGVSFHKGCFLGQEIVARMEHLGKLKKKMRFEVAQADQAISSDKEVICEVIHPASGLRYQLTLHPI